MGMWLDVTGDLNFWTVQLDQLKEPQDFWWFILLVEVCKADKGSKQVHFTWNWHQVHSGPGCSQEKAHVRSEMVCLLCPLTGQQLLKLDIAGKVGQVSVTGWFLGQKSELQKRFGMTFPQVIPFLPPRPKLLQERIGENWTNPEHIPSGKLT